MSSLVRGTAEGEVMVLDLDQKRKSLIPGKLTGSRAGNYEGILRADSDGLVLALFNSTRFSTVLRAKSRASVKAKFLGSIDDIEDFGLAENALEKREGKWWLKVRDGSGNSQSYNFKVASIFQAVGWLQNLRKLTGRKEVTVVAVLGETGSGKSTFSSTLSGLKRDNPVFLVDDTVQSVTTSTSLYQTNWLGDKEAEEVIVIDTPGLSDSEGRDDEHVADMLTKLRQLGGVHAFVVLFNSENPRLRGPLEQMLATFEAAFGKKFWENTCIFFSRWYMDQKSVDRRAKNEEELAEEWNQALRTRFPAIRNTNRQSLDLPCFFVDSEAEGTEEIKSMRSEIRRFSVLARGQKEFDCRHVVPDQRALAGMFDNGAVPPEAEELATFLRASGMVDKLGGLLANGVKTLDELASLKDKYLLQLFKWTPEEIARMRAADSPSTPTSTNYNVAKDLKKLGLPVEKLSTSGLGAAELIAMKESDVMDALGFNLMQLLKFNQWKANTLKGFPVSQDLIFEGCIVSRREAAWPYQDTFTTFDGRGPGMVINWRDMDGNISGVTEAPPSFVANPQTFQPPTVPGWATVFWFATGLSNRYRVGADGIHELEFDSAFDQGIEGDATNPLESSFEPATISQGSKPSSSQLRCTFGFERKESPVFSMFDIRPEICMGVAGVKHGDVLRVGQLEVVAVGVAITVDTNTGNPEPHMFLKTVGRDEGAMVFPPDVFQNAQRLRTMTLQCKTYADFEEHEGDFLPNDVIHDIQENLKPDFDYPVGSAVVDPGTFDVREEMFEKFGVEYRHGDVVSVKLGVNEWQEATVIGIRAPNGEQPGLWLHVKGEAGATGFAGLECRPCNVKMLGKKVAVKRYDWEKDAFKGPTETYLKSLQLKPTVEFALGLGMLDFQFCKFDVRKEVCKKFCGFESGTVLRMGTSPKTITVVGVYAAPPMNTMNIYFHLEGTLGAGILPNYNKIFPTLTNEKTVNIEELAAEVKGARMQILNQFRSIGLGFGGPQQ